MNIKCLKKRDININTFHICLTNTKGVTIPWTKGDQCQKQQSVSGLAISSFKYYTAFQPQVLKHIWELEQKKRVHHSHREIQHYCQSYSHLQGTAKVDKIKLTLKLFFKYKNLI